MRDNMNPGCEYLYVSTDITGKVQELIFEYKNPRNDGWVQEGFRNQLEALKATIQDALEN